MRYLRLVSDLHLDVDVDRWEKNWTHRGETDLAEVTLVWFPPPMEGDADTVLVVPGDIWEKWPRENKAHDFLTASFPTGPNPHRKISWARKVANQFKYVVVCLGNHDYWYQSFDTRIRECKQQLHDAGLDNFFLLEGEHVVLDQVKFVGGTLWTDYNNSPVIKNACQFGFKDYDRIRKAPYHPEFGGVKTTPDDFSRVFDRTSQYIFKHAHRDPVAAHQLVIALTHTAPTYHSVTPRWRTSADAHGNYFYFSDLEKQMRKSEIDYWFHGHMHETISYEIPRNGGGDVKVRCNPRGVIGGAHANQNFDPCWRIEL